MADRYGQHTEYGGGDNSPQRFGDGSAKELTAREEARVLRQAGARGDVDATAGDLVVEPKVGESGQEYEQTDAERRAAYRKKQIADLRIRTNSYVDTLNVDEAGGL